MAALILRRWVPPWINAADADRSRIVIAYRVAISVGLATLVGGAGLRVWPLPADRRLLDLITVNRPALYTAFLYAYATVWFFTPFLVITIVSSFAYIFVAPADRAVRPLPSPPYPRPEHRDDLFLILGEHHRRASVAPAADPRSLIIPELQIDKPNVVLFEARRAQHDLPAVTIRDLPKATLRHRPDRVIVGEVRGREAYDLLQASNTGHAGSLSTIHPDSASQALARFASCVLRAGVELPYVAIRQQTGDAIALILHLERRQGVRRASERIPLSRYIADGDHYLTDELTALVTGQTVSQSKRSSRMACEVLPS